jgi:hypothetical protein
MLGQKELCQRTINSSFFIKSNMEYHKIMKRANNNKDRIILTDEVDYDWTVSKS